VIIAFYIFGAAALITTALALGSRQPVHGLLFLVLSFFSVAVIFFIMGAPFAAALEVIIYAGAIVVLILFVIMMLNVNVTKREKFRFLKFAVPLIMCVLLFFEFLYVFIGSHAFIRSGMETAPRDLGKTLLGPYVAGVELASLLLLSGLVGAFHLGRRSPIRTESPGPTATDERKKP